MRRNITDEADAIYTDELASHVGVETATRKHETVNHSKEEWVVGDMHTNSVEGVWSLFKRSIVGSFHARSPSSGGISPLSAVPSEVQAPESPEIPEFGRDRAGQAVARPMTRAGSQVSSVQRPRGRNPSANSPDATTGSLPPELGSPLSRARCRLAGSLLPGFPVRSYRKPRPYAAYQLMLEDSLANALRRRADPHHILTFREHVDAGFRREIGFHQIAYPMGLGLKEGLGVVLTGHGSILQAEGTQATAGTSPSRRAGSLSPCRSGPPAAGKHR